MRLTAIGYKESIDWPTSDAAAASNMGRWVATNVATDDNLRAGCDLYVMRLQFASQFFEASSHMPFGRLIKPVAPTLLLLGNTVNPWTIGGRNFLRAAAAEFDRVMLVPGPAEYTSNRQGCFRLNLRRLYEETALYSNIHVLCQKTATVGETEFVGGTLWTERADTSWVRERMLRAAATEEEGDALVLAEIRKEVAASMRVTDRNFFNGALLNARPWAGFSIEKKDRARAQAKPARLVFGSYFLPHYECLTTADVHAGGIETIVNDYRYMMRAPLQLWLCGAGIGGKNYWDRETGILFAKNARGNGEEAAAGYSPEMFMDVGTVEIRDRRAGIDALTIVAQNADRTDLPPVPAPDVDFFPEENDDPAPP